MARRDTTPPTLKRASRGFFYTRWGGNMYTFGSDEKKARTLFLAADSVHNGSLRAWQNFISIRHPATNDPANDPANDDAHKPHTPRTVLDLAREFFRSYEDESRDKTAAYFRGALRRFVGVYGAMPPTAIDLRAIEAFRRDLLQLEVPYGPIPADGSDRPTRRLAPKTIAHDLKAIRTFWRWAARFYPERCRPIELSGIKIPRQREPQSHAISLEAVRSMIAKGAAAHPELRAWLTVAYLCLLRPSEVIRLASGEGRFIPIYYPTAAEPLTASTTAIPTGAGEAVHVAERGLFVMASKVGHLTGSARYVVVTDEAERWIMEAQRPSVIQSGRRRGQLGPKWTRLDNFSQAVRSACGFGPSVLRDSAATHLAARGVAMEVVDQLLGHVPSLVQRSYIQRSWHAHRDAAALLRL